MREVTSKEDTNEWWEENSKVIRRVAEEVLGKTSGKGMPQGKNIWWWSEEVQVKIKEKKAARRKFETSGREEDRAAAKSANKEIKDGEGRVLSDENEIRNRWKVYFEKLLNEENERRVFGEATGPNEVPAEAWKSLGDDGVDLLWDLFSKIYDQGKMPNAWRESVIIPIYKEKGDIQECGNYR
ncbi:uncharacterized protein LOC134766090 [Penaeus indicus]|uniref:uncharacterized protein LOC134766090 n=1 Tax=Penaeus indicus TaxID=29960 RepID=UPI00300D71DB